MSNQHTYNDPYYQTPYSADTQGYPSHGMNPADSHLEPPLPYNEVPRYNTSGYQSSPALYKEESIREKVVEDDALEDTARSNPGRQRPTSSWANGPPPRSTGILRMWRKEERGKQWTKGGGCRSFLRLFCCCGSITIVLIVSIVLALLLYVRPPNISLNSVSVDTSSVAITTSGLSLNFKLAITVANPNWFNADFKEITATATYPGVDNSPIGGGSLSNVNFKGYTESTFDFPFAINYTTAIDPNRVILNDIVSKCGVTGSASDLTIDYQLTLKLKILGVTVSPTINNKASFQCPISASDIEGVIGSS